jgi:hypothetical protein
MCIDTDIALLAPPPPEDAEGEGYPRFTWDCFDAIGKSFHACVEHPLMALVREQQQRLLPDR